MGSKRQQYTREFKVAAVRRMTSREKPATAIARELGVAVNQLYRWKAALVTQPAAPVADVFPGHGQRSAADEELHRLRRENAVLREERDILKKATAVFARESR
jgi:transposase